MMLYALGNVTPQKILQKLKKKNESWNLICLK